MAQRRKASSAEGVMTLPKSGLLVDKPAPRLVTKVFHKTPVAVFEGRVRVEDIEGWVENQRIVVLVKKYQRHFGRTPTNKELYSLLLENDREFKIKELARSIFWNGVRVPVVVDADGRLLDGNRRYFATLHLLKTDEANRSNYETIPAIVLPADVDEPTKNKVVIESNFVEDPKLDWSPYVKASLVQREADQQRMPDLRVLADRFGWTTNKVRQALETMAIVNEFINYHAESPDPAAGLYRLGDALEAEIRAAEHYTLFHEARNSYGPRLLADLDFKQWFFEMMVSSPFRSVTEVRQLWDCWNDRNAKDELLKRTPSAIERAIVIVRAKKAGLPLDDPKDVDDVVRQEKYERKLRDFAKFLSDVPVGVIAALSHDTEQALRDALERIVLAREALSPAAVDGTRSESN